MADEEFVIGIDLGTTNSVVATVQGKRPVVLRTRADARLTPSVVAFSAAGKRLVGVLAKRQAATNPRGTVYASKRLIGRKFSSEQVQGALRLLPYEVVCGEHDDVRVKLGGRELALPELSAMILRELKADAEAALGAPVTRAVITVPAYFNDGQRQATKDAGVIAGLDVLRIINEPTAAALAYGFGSGLQGVVVIFDLGGGTFDLSVLEVANGVFEVIATGGDTLLGGEDFDNRIIDWLAASAQADFGVDPRQDVFALQRLKDVAEKTKIALSTQTQAAIDLPFLLSPEGGGGALHFNATLTRANMEALTQDLVARAIDICGKVMAEARVKPSDLKEVLLVGGMTHMPQVVEAVRKLFGRAPCQDVDPEEVVALGAAVQAEALTARDKEVLLLDVTPLSLGVAVAGGYARRLIPKNTTVPVSVTETFNTSRDLQTSVKIVVLQGESDVARQNELLGEFTLSGLREARRGEVEVEVTFEISADGLVSVSARDKETGAEQSITVTPSGGLTHSELFDILDAQADELLEARSTGELDTQRVRLEELVREVAALLPSLRAFTQTSGIGAEALVKGQRQLEEAQQVLKTGASQQWAGAVEQLTRTATVFRTVLQRPTKS